MSEKNIESLCDQLKNDNLLSGHELRKLVEYDKRRIRNVDKSDFSTREGVFDNATLVCLHKMINRNLIIDIDDCISCGKEANVYHAYSEDNLEVAVKVFRTTILKFKDREKYVIGDYRFQSSYSKMVLAWARKEIVNLNRLFQAKIRVPKPIKLVRNILLMEFIGQDGKAAPTLREYVSNFSGESLKKLYFEAIVLLKQLFSFCKIVHADFSEYNIMVFCDELIVFDVAQAVEFNHPMAFTFLKRDCHNINYFFSKNDRSLKPLSLKSTFEFVTSIENGHFPTKESYMQSLNKLYELNLENPTIDHYNEEIFKNIDIPFSLSEIKEKLVELEIEKYNRGENLLYGRLLPELIEDNPESDYDEPVVDEDINLDNDIEQKEKLPDFLGSKPQVSNSKKIRFQNMTKEEKNTHKKSVKQMKTDRKKKKTFGSNRGKEAQARMK
ncbi:MAG: Serine/threonine-protein kinase RIO1 [Paramarteilia canceri]